MGWRNTTSNALAVAAAHIGLAPAKFVMWVAPDNGPGGTAWAVITGVVSLAVTSPVTLPLLITAGLLQEKKK